MTHFKYQGMRNNSSKISLTLYPPVHVLHLLTWMLTAGERWPPSVTPLSYHHSGGLRGSTTFSWVGLWFQGIAPPTPFARVLAFLRDIRVNDLQEICLDPRMTDQVRKYILAHCAQRRNKIESLNH